MQHASIDRAIVVGVKHHRLGEVVAAFLQSPPGKSEGTEPLLSDDDVRGWVRVTLGRHKAPEHVFWLGRDGIPDALPLTGSGKVRKFELARVAEQILAKSRARL